MPRRREIAVQFGHPDHTARGGVHYAEADILLERLPLGTCGAAEASRFVWILADIPDEYEIGPHLDAQGHLVTKARFNLPVGEIQKVLPGFLLSRARDPLDVYQPFLPVTQQPDGHYAFHDPVVVFALAGHVYDKQQGGPR